MADNAESHSQRQIGEGIFVRFTLIALALIAIAVLLVLPLVVVFTEALASVLSPTGRR